MAIIPEGCPIRFPDHSKINEPEWFSRYSEAKQKHLMELFRRNVSGNGRLKPSPDLNAYGLTNTQLHELYQYMQASEPYREGSQKGEFREQKKHIDALLLRGAIRKEYTPPRFKYL
eukprot:UN34311